MSSAHCHIQPVSDAQARDPQSGRRINVLHLIYSVCHGGIETALINWVKHFDSSRFNIHVAYFANDRNREAPLLKAAEAEQIDLLPVPWGRRKPFIKAARAVARIVRDLDIDIIHTHAYYADMVGAIAGALTPARTVATVYVWGKYELHRQIMQFLDFVAIQFIDEVTAHCSDTARKTVKLGRRNSDIRILTSGFPVDREPLPASERLSRRRRQGIRDDRMILLNVARLAPEKAQDQLLQAFRRIHDQYPNSELWISGVGLPDVEAELLALRDKLSLRDAVHFVGYQYDIWSLLDVADFMVHPSHVEGVPLAILYGMAAALPIVVSDVGGVSEVIKDGVTGRLIEENDTTGLAEAVLSLIADRNEAGRLGTNARHFVETDFSIESAVRRVEKTYREVLRSS